MLFDLGHGSATLLFIKIKPIYSDDIINRKFLKQRCHILTQTFCSQATEDEMRLLRFQRKLDEEKGAGLLGLSLQVDWWAGRELLSLNIHNGGDQPCGPPGIPEHGNLLEYKPERAPLVPFRATVSSDITLPVLSVKRFCFNTDDQL